jgi:hypothetical protein
MDVRTVHVREGKTGWETWTKPHEKDCHSSRAGAMQSATLWAFVYRPACVVMDVDGHDELVQYYPDRGFDPGRVASELPELYM